MLPTTFAIRLRKGYGGQEATAVKMWKWICLKLRCDAVSFLDRINRIYKIMNIDEICYKVIGAAMAVHRHFGAGYLEEVYKNALMVELDALGLKSEKEIPIAVNYKGVLVGDYRAGRTHHRYGRRGV
jgi:hypothetical protein